MIPANAAKKWRARFAERDVPTQARKSRNRDLALVEIQKPVRSK